MKKCLNSQRGDMDEDNCLGSSGSAGGERPNEREHAELPISKRNTNIKQALKTAILGGH